MTGKKKKKKKWARSADGFYYGYSGSILLASLQSSVGFLKSVGAALDTDER